MTERERLIELLTDTQNSPEKTCPRLNGKIGDCCSCKYDEGDSCSIHARTADYLIENGIAVLPCEIGDKVHEIDTD